MNLENYFKRLNVTNITDNSLNTLQHLQMSHLLQIPFENLDVIYKRPISLDVETFYGKIITNYRGGFCFELNGLFKWLLDKLDYETYFVAAEVFRADGTWSIERSHVAIIVQLDQPYLVDVGFGDSCRIPLPFTGEIREDTSGRYRIIQESEQVQLLQREEEASWRTLLRIDMKPRDLTDFTYACHYNQTSPQSIFTKKEIVTIATVDGRYTLSDGNLTITKNGEKIQMKIAAEKKKEILQNHFHFKLENIPF